jgi:hypothetical protein
MAQPTLPAYFISPFQIDPLPKILVSRDILRDPASSPNSNAQPSDSQQANCVKRLFRIIILNASGCGAAASAHGLGP